MDFAQTILEILSYWKKLFIPILTLTILSVLVVIFALDLPLHFLEPYSSIFFGIVFLIPLSALAARITHFIQGDTITNEQALKIGLSRFFKLLRFVVYTLFFVAVFLVLPIISSPGVICIAATILAFKCTGSYLRAMGFSTLAQKIGMWVILLPVLYWLSGFIPESNLWPIFFIMPGIVVLGSPWALPLLFPVFIVVCGYLVSCLPLIISENSKPFATMKRSYDATKKSGIFVFSILAPILLLPLCLYFSIIRLHDFLIMHLEIGYTGQAYINMIPIPLILLLILPLILIAMVVISEKLK
jgi:hypothetical protein